MGKDSTYSHYQPFRSGLAKAMRRMSGRTKRDMSIDEALRIYLSQPDMEGTIDAEILMLEHWFEQGRGRILVPETNLSSALSQVKLESVSGSAWQWPHALTALSLPNDLRFGGERLDGAMVAWLRASELHNEWYLPFYQHLDLSKRRSEHQGGEDDHILVIATRDPIPEGDAPTMLRMAYTESEITDFINRESMKDFNARYAELELDDTERNVMRELSRYVLTLGMYISAYPESVTDGIPTYMRNKYSRKASGQRFVGVSQGASDTITATPYKVAPFFRQLRDERYYRGQHAHRRPGSRYVLVSGWDVAGDKTQGVSNC